MTLRRGSGLTRYTELARTPLDRASELTRSTPLARTARIRTHAEFRAARPTISRDEREARRLVRERADGRCEGCGRHGPTEWAHRVRRGPGAWCASNGLALCGFTSGLPVRPGVLSCHEWSHSFVIEARSVGWTLRTNTDPLTVPALLHGRGLTYLTADGDYRPAPPIEGDAA